MILGALLFAAAAANAQPMPGFMAGCWQETRDGGRWTEECWTDTRGGLMIGSSREGANGSVNDWEWMRIERNPDGPATYYASPKGAPTVAFKASGGSATSVTFVNAGHDYPQRIRYELKGGKLEAEISLIDGSKPMRWTYVREQP